MKEEKRWFIFVGIRFSVSAPPFPCDDHSELLMGLFLSLCIIFIFGKTSDVPLACIIANFLMSRMWRMDIDWPVSNIKDPRICAASHNTFSERGFLLLLYYRETFCIFDWDYFLSTVRWICDGAPVTGVTWITDLRLWLPFYHCHHQFSPTFPHLNATTILCCCHLCYY